MKKRYYLSNGFHNTSTFVLVEPKEGARVSGEAMRRAGRALCPYADCTCSGSGASNTQDHQAHGIEAHPEFHLVPAYSSFDDGAYSLMEV